MSKLSSIQIFISYSRRDTGAMQRIVKYLRGQGLNVWVDNERLVPGTPIWEKEIEKAIKSTKVVIVCLSPEAKESVWVLNELTLADEYKKRIFPVLVRGEFRDAVPFRLVTRQFVDLKKDEIGGLNSLGNAIHTYLDELKLAEEESAIREQERLVEEKAEQEKAKAATKEKIEREVTERSTQEKAKQSQSLVQQLISRFNSRIFLGAIATITLILCVIAGYWIVNNIIPVSVKSALSTEETAKESAVTEEIVITVEPESTEESMPIIGSTEHPINILFIPSVDTQTIMSGGEILASALHEATGLYFEVVVPTSYLATIEEMCASTSDTMGFIPSLGYVLANRLCGVDVSFAAVRLGSPAYWGEILVKRNSNIWTLADLNGLRWGIVDTGSTSGYMVPLAMLQDAGVVPGETVVTGGHTQAVLAVYNGEVDFATTFYTTPLTPEGAYAWTYDDYIAGKVTPDMWDIPAVSIPNCSLNTEGTRLLCDGWRVLDARASIRTEAPDVVQQVRILELSPAVSNDTLSFGPDFPTNVRAQIEQALIAISQTESWSKSIGSSDLYGWTGLYPITNAEYEFTRKMIDASGFTLENLGQ